MSSKFEYCLSGRPVIIRRLEELPSAEIYKIDAGMCLKQISWEATLYLGSDSADVVGIDVTPVLASMDGVNYDPYGVGEAVLSIVPSDITGTLLSIAEVLTADFVKYQENLIDAVTTEEFRFLIDMLKGIPNHALLVESSRRLSLAVEFPLLDSARLKHPSLEYLADILQQSPIMAHISLSCSVEGKIATDSSLVFPDSMLRSKDIEVPPWDYESLTIFEYISLLEKVLLANWELRYVFMKHLQSISAIVELDCTDFSYAAFVLRAKQRNMFSMCSIEIKLTASFPKEPPIIIFFDMKTSISTIVNSHELLAGGKYYDVSWPAQRLADGVFLYCWEKLIYMSFGVCN